MRGEGGSVSATNFDLEFLKIDAKFCPPTVDWGPPVSFPLRTCARRKEPKANEHERAHARVRVRSRALLKPCGSAVLFHAALQAHGATLLLLSYHGSFSATVAEGS